MTNKRYQIDERKIARFMREGRGQGVGEFYKPWLTVADAPSRGRVHRVWCPKTGRTHHFFSDNEYYAFLVFWWDDNVTDIREHFPLLDRRETQEIATRRNIRHPVDPASGALRVMTTDFLITNRSSHGVTLGAHAVTEENALGHRRALENLEIERAYWERRNVPWRLMLSSDLKNGFTRNLAWLFPSSADEQRRPSALSHRIRQHLLAALDGHAPVPVRHLCSSIDGQLSCRPGESLGVLRRLLAEKTVSVDLWLSRLQDAPASAFSLRRKAA